MDKIKLCAEALVLAQASIDDFPSISDEDYQRYMSYGKQAPARLAIDLLEDAAEALKMLLGGGGEKAND